MKKVINCLTEDNPVINKKLRKVSVNEGLKIAEELLNILSKRKDSIGLAANQVGKGLAVTVIDIADAEEDGIPSPLTLINPVIEAFSDEEEEFEEGCLSLPDFRDRVIRPEAIQVRYLDRFMKEQVAEVGGLLARVMQHEIDHLHGIYFFERLSPIRRTLSSSKLKRIAKGQVETEYPLHKEP